MIFDYGADRSRLFALGRHFLFLGGRMISCMRAIPKVFGLYCLKLPTDIGLAGAHFVWGKAPSETLGEGRYPYCFYLPS